MFFTAWAKILTSVTAADSCAVQLVFTDVCSIGSFESVNPTDCPAGTYNGNITDPPVVSRKSTRTAVADVLQIQSLVRSWKVEAAAASSDVSVVEVSVMVFLVLNPRGALALTICLP